MSKILRRLNKTLLHAMLTDGLNMVCNRLMAEKHADAALIEALGGPAEVARKLELDPAKGGVQRVQNWITRGIPPAIRLSRLDLFGIAPPQQSRAEGEAA